MATETGEKRCIVYVIDCQTKHMCQKWELDVPRGYGPGPVASELQALV